jgi:dihydroorotase
MLVDSEATLEKIFSSTSMLIAVHCEDETTIRNNLAQYKTMYGRHTSISPSLNQVKKRVTFPLQKWLLLKTGARLHISSFYGKKEMELFTNKIPVRQENYCQLYSHHLWFTS